MKITVYNIFPEADKGNVDVLNSQYVDKIKDTSMQTPLHIIACKSGEVLKHPSVDKVLDNGLNTPLHNLACRMLIKESWEHPSFATVKNYMGWTPLHCACWGGDYELLDHSYIMRVFDDENRTPLHIFAREGSYGYELIKKKFSWFDFEYHEKKQLEKLKRKELTEKRRMKIITELVNTPNSVRFIKEN